MKNPTYDDVSEIVENLLRAKSKKINAIGHYGKEDICQELRIKCFKATKKYSLNRGNITNFLGVCIDNALIDLLRKHTLKKSNVCFYCLYNLKNECLYYKDIKKCSKYRKYLKRKKKKESISFLRGDSSFEWGDVIDQDSGDNKNVVDKIKKIRKYLNEYSKKLFDAFFNDGNITEEQRVVLFEEVKYIIDKHID